MAGALGLQIAANERQIEQESRSKVDRLFQEVIDVVISQGQVIKPGEVDAKEHRGE